MDRLSELGMTEWFLVIVALGTIYISLATGPSKVGYQGNQESATAVAVATDAVAPEPDSSGCTVTHKVVVGETLSVIALVYGTSWQDIASNSKLTNPNYLRPGWTLCITR